MTSVQKRMLVELSKSINHASRNYDELKSLALNSWAFNSFDGTFNFLLHKGYVQPYTLHNDNSFLMTIKGCRKADQCN